MSQLDYAPLAELTGRCSFAPEVFNCSAPGLLKFKFQSSVMCSSVTILFSFVIPKRNLKTREYNLYLRLEPLSPVQIVIKLNVVLYFYENCCLCFLAEYSQRDTLLETLSFFSFFTRYLLADYCFPVILSDDDVEQKGEGTVSYTH